VKERREGWNGYLAFVQMLKEGEESEMNIMVFIC
jgi:hypothetical protein